eukprot:GFYU01002956.1.p2 GENE.GFYU01002956.1~~GFYU01002956.1.p2  ORF type:complete len:298 (-),score=117.23 GFYU01002956.1:304-1197(-)
MMKFAPLIVLALLPFALAAQKVKVDFYTEAECSDCIHFLKGALTDVMNAPGLLDVADIRLIVSGNAYENPDGTVVCQHGDPECVGNVIEACAASYYPNIKQWYPYMSCMDDGNGQPQYAQYCAQHAGMDYKKIYACAISETGAKIVHQNIQETNALQPSHEYVPWVVLNGFPLRDERNNLLYHICEVYDGPKPAGCNMNNLKPVSTEEKHKKKEEDSKKPLTDGKYQKAVPLFRGWDQNAVNPVLLSQAEEVDGGVQKEIVLDREIEQTPYSKPLPLYKGWDRGFLPAMPHNYNKDE